MRYEIVKHIADVAHSHSTYNLSEVGNSEAEEKKKNQQKKKSNRISRVIEEFISMGDAISYADKRISKYGDFNFAIQMTLSKY